MGYPIYHSQYTAAQIEALIAHGVPIISGGTWWTWDIATGAYVDTGTAAEAFAVIEVDDSTSPDTVATATAQALAVNRAVVMRYRIMPGNDDTYVDMPLAAVFSLPIIGGDVSTQYLFYGHSSGNQGKAMYAEIEVVDTGGTGNVVGWKTRPTAYAVLPKKQTMSVSATWTGSASPYTQTVSVTGVGSRSKVDIQLTATQIAALQAAKVTALAVENSNGTLTLYAFGAKPTEAMTLQCTVQETN